MGLAHLTEWKKRFAMTDIEINPVYSLDYGTSLPAGNPVPHDPLDNLQGHDPL